MTVIAEKNRPTVGSLLARELVADVELIFFTRGRGQPLTTGQHPCLSCEETGELLGDLVGLSERLHLTTYDVGADPGIAKRYNVNAVPTVLIRRLAAKSDDEKGDDTTTMRDAPGSGAGITGRSLLTVEPGTNVRFVGQPGGYEFSTLVADIVDVSNGRTSLAAETVAAVRAIDVPVNVKVFVAPGCPYCPPVARMAHQLAMVNPLIVAEVIEANEFAELSERYRVRTVPKTVVNDRIEFVGSLPEAKVLEALKEAVRQDG